MISTVLEIANSLDRLITAAILYPFKNLGKVALVATVALSMVILGAKSTELHSKWLRSRVESKIYRIKDSPTSGGGTGFAVKAPSGNTYILTNDHVCGVSKDGEHVMVETESGAYISRRILSRSDFTDLCLVEAIPGVEGMSLGSDPSPGDTLYVVGHPSLLPLTMIRGEYIGREDVDIIKGVISAKGPDGVSIEVPGAKQCQGEKNVIEENDVQSFFGAYHVTFCLNVTRAAYTTNAQIQPGSSGSPIFSFFGNVNGVIFAGDQMGWGRAVSRTDIVRFLKMY